MNKKGIITIIAILVILLIIGVVTGVIIYKNNSKVNNNQSGQQENQDETASLIDMNNTENAKVEEGIKENTSKKEWQTTYYVMGYDGMEVQLFGYGDTPMESFTDCMEKFKYFI